MRYIKHILSICFVVLVLTGFSQTHRDSINVLHYNLHLDISTVSAHKISAYAEVELLVNMPCQHLYLDLFHLEVDSIVINQEVQNFNYNDTLITINHSVADISDTITVFVYYQGSPWQDSQWGGFYFDGNYAYNMGVGMGSYPHSVGRFWYPCIDSFTDRATYDFYIKTALGNAAICGGVLIDTLWADDLNPIFHWKITQSIPTYLSSVAVGPYIEIADSYDGIEREIPIAIYAEANDVAGVEQTFVNLKNTLASYENHFGAYPWERVGYVVVPFGGGAMEHAMNTAFPDNALTGSVSNQNLAAHELAHSWFGNLVTCERSEEMWLNEGWASYCEAIFKTAVFGVASGHKHIQSNHEYVLQSAHSADGGYYALDNIPQHITYGKTVYDKGADVVHSIRGYLGDSLFFEGVKSYLSTHKFMHANSVDMANALTAATGVDMLPFFNNWVFQPGFPHYSVDSFYTIQSETEFITSIALHQKLKYRDTYGNKNRFPLTLMDKNWNRLDTIVEFDGQFGAVGLHTAFEPTALFSDLNHRVNDATTHSSHFVTESGNLTFDYCDFQLVTKQIEDSVLINVIFNWVLPASFITPINGLTLSDYHYWKIEGLKTDGFVADGKFSYSFSQNTNPDNGYEPGPNDTLVLIYRENAGKNWSVVAKGPSAKIPVGNLYCENLKFGEYAIAYWDGISDIGLTINSFDMNIEPKIFPNPFNNRLTIRFADAYEGNVHVFNSHGKRVFEKEIRKHKKLVINTSKFESGVYYLNIDKAETKKILIKM